MRVSRGRGQWFVGRGQAASEHLEADQEGPRPGLRYIGSFPAGPLGLVASLGSWFGGTALRPCDLTPELVQGMREGRHWRVSPWGSVWGRAPGPRPSGQAPGDACG